LSPAVGRLIDFFEDLVYFVQVFPHPRLTIEIAPVDIEEHRVPILRKRRRGREFRVVDQRLLALRDTLLIQRPTDLWQLLPADLPLEFDSRHLSQSATTARWLAQRICYCLRQTGAAAIAGKQ